MSEAPDQRMRFFDGASDFTKIVAADSSGTPILVRSDDQTVGRMLFIRGSRPEHGLLDRAVAVIRKEKSRRLAGTVFVDIGANIGTSTIAALTQHPFARAVACEPEPANYRLLRANLALNGLEERVLTLPVAVSNAVGPQMLMVHPTNSGGHLLEPSRRDAPLVEIPANARRIPVERVTLDFLVERDLVDPEEVGLLWMDVQGSEGRVLKGAHAILSLGVPVVLEMHPGLLALSGGTPSLLKDLARYYTHIVDLRQTSVRREVRYRLLPVSDTSGLLEQLERDNRFADVLALRLARG